ncbi:tRNA-dihydrouridine synthase [Candidatus Gracilibacteria bacterium]|nr:tRNA-dihydrouridine synthase [Candidatus Gracilibacteria bacterium]MCF7819351.1 tRNA-dihydrouridine synthase [Candidatus Gracilibacteria bacterium]
MKRNFWKEIPRPILTLAPMAGYTESPFRRLVKAIEPSVVLISELVSTEALRHRNEKTMQLVEFTPEEKDFYCVQLFGKEETSFLEAVKIVEDLGVDGIDLNLGCPSPKIVGSGHGSALLRDPDATARLIEKITCSTDLPVSVKTRLGFYDDRNLVQTAKSFESAGIASLAIHGRTTQQKFSGSAQWEKIYEVKENVSIPVLGNGDVTSVKIAVQRLKNLDGIMIGRAALRNPWIFAQCRAAFEGKTIPPKPSLEQQIDFFRRHAQLAAQMKGEKWAMIEMRKHFAHCIRGIRGAARFRDRLIRVSGLDELEEIFQEILLTEPEKTITETGDLRDRKNQK